MLHAALMAAAPATQRTDSTHVLAAVRDRTVSEAVRERPARSRARTGLVWDGRQLHVNTTRSEAGSCQTVLERPGLSGTARIPGSCPERAAILVPHSRPGSCSGGRTRRSEVDGDQ